MNPYFQVQVQLYFEFSIVFSYFLGLTYEKPFSEVHFFFETCQGSLKNNKSGSVIKMDLTLTNKFVSLNKEPHGAGIVRGRKLCVSRPDQPTQIECFRVALKLARLLSSMANTEQVIKFLLQFHFNLTRHTLCNSVILLNLSKR